MIHIKPGVRLLGLQPQMLIALRVMECLFDKHKLDCTITSGCDGRHKEYSSHYSGNALDFRIWGLAEEAVKVLVTEAQAALGEDFFVLLESDHIHIQYKPRRNFSG